MSHNLILLIIGGLVKFLIFIFLFFSLPAFAAVEQFERTEVNLDFNYNSSISFGFKEFANHGNWHRWIRYKFIGTPHQIEFRNVQFLNGTRNENWYRYQFKNIDGNFFYWSRFEYREIGGKLSHLRYRPRIGFKHKVKSWGTPYIFVEPHWNTKDNKIPLIMTYVGTKWMHSKYDFGVFIQTQSNNHYDMQRIFVGLDFLYKI